MARWSPSAVDVSFGVPGLGFSVRWRPTSATALTLIDLIEVTPERSR